jgi:signal transduction histidine kinase
VDVGARALRWWRSLPTLVVDAALAFVVLVVSLVEIARGDESTDDQATGLLLLVAMSVVITFRRLHPVMVWAVTGVLATAYGLGTFEDPTLPYAPLVAVYTVAAHTTWATAVRAGLVTLVAAIVALLVDRRDDLVDWIVVVLALTTAWLIGTNVRTQRAYAREMEARAAQLERERAAEAAQAAAEERLRLARELHDVAAHHVSVIALHAEAGQSMLREHPDRADEAFTTIAGVARTTLDELRFVVGALRDRPDVPMTPQPALAHVDALVHEVRRTGLDVSLSVEGPVRPLASAVESSAYRIVQEALTNVIRHAGPARAEVHITYDDDGVAVEVLDDGLGPPPDESNGGHGLAGMRERASLVGGSLSAAPRPEGGFSVRALFPS